MTIGEEFRPALTGASCATTPGTGMDLLFAILAQSAQDPVIEDEEDQRPAVIDQLVRDATPEIRTRAAQLAGVLSEFALRARRVVMAAKIDLQDPDIVQGRAEIMPQGWLVVTMGDVLIGRVPYNPDRGSAEAARMAEEILAEHVRLHVMQSADALDSVALPPDARELPVRDDGVRAVRLVVS